MRSFIITFSNEFNVLSEDSGAGPRVMSSLQEEHGTNINTWDRWRSGMNIFKRIGVCSTTELL